MSFPAARPRRWLAALALLTGLSWGRPAQAWDPSTTHAAMVRDAVLQSPLHVRWMEQSGLARGVFTPLALDPARLDPQERRVIEQARRYAHAGSGARPLGGPGACPGPSAPASTRALCVQGDLWEASALGWLQLGLVVELTPRRRLLHHFLDGDEPTALKWEDEDLPDFVLRARDDDAGGSFASRVNRTAFEGEAPSAVAWLESDDPWALPATREHLRKAATAESRVVRSHHLARALIGIGALLHVTQDLSVPAHARGDLTAFFAPLSPTPGDRGLPLMEFARLQYGRQTLPSPPLTLRTRASAASPPAQGDEAEVEQPKTEPEGPLAPTVLGHWLGAPGFEGLARRAGSRFLSESTMPPPRVIAPDASPEAAATAILGDGAGLLPEEREGARLTPWPAAAGYLVSSTGRMLAAFDTDEQGRIRLYLDRRVYRSQSNQLIPVAVDVSASVLDLLFPAFPSVDVDREGRSLELALNEDLQDPTITIFLENTAGDRARVSSHRLRPGQPNRLDGVLPAEQDEQRVVLVLEGRSAAGTPWLSEYWILPEREEAETTDLRVPRPGAARPPAERPSRPVPQGAAPAGDTPGVPPEGEAPPQEPGREPETDQADAVESETTPPPTEDPGAPAQNEQTPADEPPQSPAARKRSSPPKGPAKAKPSSSKEQDDAPPQDTEDTDSPFLE